jgi:alginate O-acetyltransferase complex protein AlgI
MLLGGLWHGASWTFVVWGGLHGLYLAVERLLTARFAGAAIAQTWLFRVWLALLTYFFVNLTWVFFRAEDFATAWRMITSMFGFAPQDAGTPLPTLWIVQVVVTIVAMVAIHWRMRDTSIEAVVQKIPAPLLGVTLGAMLFLIIITQGSGNAFIYFQF